MFLASAMKDRITLQRHDVATGEWTDLETDPVIWGEVTPIGDEGYRIRIRYRTDLFGLKDTEPTMRVLWRDRVLDITDVLEAERHREVHLIARGRQIPTKNLATGAKRRTSWP
jgi:hypothetical protein